MKNSDKRNYKPGLATWVMACTLILAVSGCGGGGDSEPADAAPPPAPSGNSAGDPAGSGDPVDLALKLSCAATPGSGNAGSVAPDGQVTATFTFNKPFVGNAVVSSGRIGSGAVLPSLQNVAINGTQVVVNRKASSVNGVFFIQLLPDGTNLEGECTWAVE